MSTSSSTATASPGSETAASNTPSCDALLDGPRLGGGLKLTRPAEGKIVKVVRMPIGPPSEDDKEASNTPCGDALLDGPRASEAFSSRPSGRLKLIMPAEVSREATSEDDKGAANTPGCDAPLDGPRPGRASSCDSLLDGPRPREALGSRPSGRLKLIKQVEVLRVPVVRMPIGPPSEDDTGQTGASTVAWDRRRRAVSEGLLASAGGAAQLPQLSRATRLSQLSREEQQQTESGDGVFIAADTGFGYARWTINFFACIRTYRLGTGTVTEISFFWWVRL